MTLVNDRGVGSPREAPLPLPTLVEKLTVAPVRALGLDRHAEGLGTLSVARTGARRGGAPGDVTLIDPGAEWTVEPERFASKGRNTPLAGRTLRGRVVATVYEGRVVHDER